MAHQGKAQPPPQQPQASSIPVLHSIAPAIFTCLTDEDLLAPFTPPADPIDRLKAKLKEIETQSEGVRSNMLNLFRRECLRLSLEGEAQEGPDADNYHLAPILSQTEVDEMIRNMTVEPHPDRASVVSKVLMSNNVYEKPNMAFLPKRSPRECAVAQVQSVMCQGLADLESYKNIIDDIKQQIKNEIAREKRKRGTDWMDLDL